MDEKQEKSITSRVKHRQTVITKLLQRIIDHCGYLTFNIRDDAFYFALTKATRSMKAARILYDNGYYEDAIILTRTAYEAYLYAAFAYNLDNEDNADIAALKQKAARDDRPDVFIMGEESPSSTG